MLNEEERWKGARKIVAIRLTAGPKAKEIRIQGTKTKIKAQKPCK